LVETIVVNSHQWPTKRMQAQGKATTNKETGLAVQIAQLTHMVKKSILIF